MLQTHMEDDRFARNTFAYLINQNSHALYMPDYQQLAIQSQKTGYS